MHPTYPTTTRAPRPLPYHADTYLLKLSSFDALNTLLLSVRAPSCSCILVPHGFAWLLLGFGSDSAVEMRRGAIPNQSNQPKRWAGSSHTRHGKRVSCSARRRSSRRPRFSWRRRTGSTTPPSSPSRYGTVLESESGQGRAENACSWCFHWSHCWRWSLRWS